MRTFIFLILTGIIMTTFAQEKTIRLYDGPAPGSESWKHKEAENNNNGWQTRVVYNVADPTLTVFSPAPSLSNGTAVVICPGGGYHGLSIDSEGFDVARWLTAKGVTCFVLKYRLVPSTTTDPVAEFSAKENIDKDVKQIVPLAMSDALHALTYVRKHADEFKINPKRIGIMGFSAGGTVTATAVFGYTKESRPDFVAPIYLQYDWVHNKGAVPVDAPPAFILAASDDGLGLAPHSVRFYNDWIAAGKSAELHLYSKGGHGFGMRKQNLPSDHWIELFASWLDVQGLLKK